MSKKSKKIGWQIAEELIKAWNLDEEIKDKDVLKDVGNAIEEAYNLGNNK